MSLERLDTDTTSIIYGFLAAQEKAKMACVSINQCLESEKNRKHKPINMNGKILKDKASIALFYELRKPKPFYDRGPWGGMECEFESILMIDNGAYFFCPDGFCSSVYGVSRYKNLFKLLKADPKLAYQITKDPVFSELFAKQCPDQVVRRIEFNQTPTITGGILGGLTGLMVSIVASLCLLPIWLASAVLLLVSWGLLWFVPCALFRSNVFTIYLSLPICIIDSFLYGVEIGYWGGTKNLKNVIQDVCRGVYYSLFVPVDEEIDIELRPCKYYSNREKTIADIAADYENNPENFVAEAVKTKMLEKRLAERKKMVEIVQAQESPAKKPSVSQNKSSLFSKKELSINLASCLTLRFSSLEK